MDGSRSMPVNGRQRIRRNFFGIAAGTEGRVRPAGRIPLLGEQKWPQVTSGLRHQPDLGRGRRHGGSLGVNIQDREASAGEFLEEFGITYPNGRDPRNRIAIDYGVYGLPETFFISRDGLITYKHIGAIEGDLLVVKMEEGLRGAVSAEGRGANYQSIR